MGIDTGSADSCEIMSNQSAVLLSALRKEAEAIAHYGSYNKRTNIVDVLNDIKSKLETKKNNILSALREVNPLLGSIVKSNPDVIESVINSRKEDQWLQFEFDSKEMEENSKFTSIRTRSEFKTSRRGWFSKSSTTRIKTYSYEKFESEMDQADLKAKGKLLRVNIKRPWFKPEVFDERKLNFVSYLLSPPIPHYCTFSSDYIGVKFREWPKSVGITRTSFDRSRLYKCCIWRRRTRRLYLSTARIRHLILTCQGY
jgi:hypothetical protein